jgi:hypothetical protein
MTHESKKAGIALRALGSLLVLLALGCSSDRQESLATRSEPLTFPVTITLTTPNPVSPTAPVLLGSNSVKLGPRAEIVTGLTVSMGTAGLSADADAFLNETWSRGTAVLRDRVRVRGILHAKTRTLGNNVVLSGSDTNPRFDPPQRLSWTVNYPSGTASDVTVNAGTRVLEPGRYRTVTVNSPGALTLKTGVYYLTGLVIQSNAVVNLDQSRGPVIVYTTDALTLRGRFLPPTGTSPDLTIVHLGSTAVFVETVYNGTLLAPSASLTFRSVGATHTGFFQAKDPVLDAGAKVAYRAPLGLIGTSTTSGSDCRRLLGSTVPEAELPKYCAICRFNTSDTDRDGIRDCVDACPSDPAKTTSAGKCGCGVLETDSDGDDVPDCLEDCDFDPNNTSPGQCGCRPGPGQPNTAKPMGTPCRDLGCGITTASTCNGQGVCGSRSLCTPAGGGACKLLQFQYASYWFCPGPVSQSAASTSCRNRQMSLVRIDTTSENDFVKRFVTGPMWIGANSITTSGVWRWSTSTSNNGDQFWQGAANGSQRNSFYSSWVKTAPASQRCAAIQPSDGNWVDLDCSQLFGFVCEAPPPPPGIPQLPNPRLPGDVNQPPPVRDGGTDSGGVGDACVPLAMSRLPDTLEQLQLDYNSADTPNPSGAAADPPPDGSAGCDDDAGSNQIGDGDGAGCTFVKVTNEPMNFRCTSNDDCTQFGSGLVCRQVKDDPGCDAGDGGGLGEVCDEHGCHKVYCSSGAHCGVLTCPPIDFPNRCDTIQVCNPDSEFNSAFDLDAGLAQGAFNPAALFPSGTLPDVTPSTDYHDPAEGTGRQHTWCFMNLQREVEPATQPELGKTGNAGGSSSINFRFEPDLSFNANVNPLSLGETNLSVHARAQLIVGVDMENIFGSDLDFSVDILRAVGDVRAERCTLRNDDTELSVLGGNFITGDEDWIFNTAAEPIVVDGFEINLVDETRACNEAVGSFINFANRAKKAFRDAQQLLTQFRQFKADGAALTTLCQDIMGLVGTGASASFFPGGLSCPPNEPPEVTINRFLDYYQAPGFGQVEQLRKAIDKLVKVTNDIKNQLKIQKRYDIVDIARQESQNLINVPFAIGPVPMVLQVDSFYTYGISGFFEYLVQFPFNPLDIHIDQKEKIAHVKAGVLPHAGAGLSAFVGAGTSLGGFSAALGVEGSITLGNLKAPIFAGAGVGAIVTKDERPFEAALQTPGVQVASQLVGLDKITHFGIPTAFKYYVWYDYGAGLRADDILKGQLNASLRIKFFFFSRTWKKQIIQFNGFSFHRDFISGTLGSESSVGAKKETLDPNAPDGSTTSGVQGNTDLGLAEPQTPLAVLQPPAIDPNDPPPTSVAHFDAGAMQSPFYDNQCCAKVGEQVPFGVDQCFIGPGGGQPGGPGYCCPGLRCAPGPEGTRCALDCKPQGTPCANDNECCLVPNHDVSCGGSDGCQKCGHAGPGTSGAPCADRTECCNSATDPLIECVSGHCQSVCRAPGQNCASVSDCCDEPGIETICDSGDICRQCIETDEPEGTGAACNVNTDCCEFEPLESTTVKCIDTTLGRRCRLVQG